MIGSGTADSAKATATREPSIRGPDRRGISTVVDVSLCLLLITASIAVITVFLAADLDRHDPTIADETAQTLATSTTTVEYSIQSVERRDDTGVFDDATYDADRYDRVHHGPLAQLLGAAAISDAGIDGDPFSEVGVEFREAVDANVRSELIGAHDHIHVIARWEPYESASIRGETAAGDRPPADADVSTVTFTVASGFPETPDDELEGTYDVENGSFDRAADPIAEAILDGQFPTESTTMALQGDGLDRSLILYEYRRWSDVLGVDAEVEREYLNRTAVDVDGANEILSENVSDVIAADLEETFDETTDAELESEDTTGEAAISATADEWLTSTVATDEVTITVRVWDE
ncbi:DUF7284 family protein [Natrarchaeobius oligotrophus]|uniref:Uncharacterized protein n=1 Tax=Natrarchaeobius chitinivorans TaxID=1679083 RepID=A0A3N6MBW7_NATCH|nr:hypothetical protein [Natrarchaeobius chitinivorans]RQH01289.1 hypothetical protein EA472_07500 [Natrarchaeobius chitinivorans]